MTNKKELSPKEKLYEEVYDKVNNYPSKHKEGLIDEEIEDIVKFFKEKYPNFNKKKFDGAMMGNTCLMKEEKFVIYHCDIRTALLCAIEDRDMYWYETD